MNNNEHQSYTSDCAQVKNETGSGAKRSVVLLCVVCAIIGSIIGGIVTGFVIKSGIEDSLSENTQSIETTATPAETTLNQVSDETTTAAVSEETQTQANIIQSGTVTSSEDKPDGKTVYSAKEIYENNVDSVVSIEVRTSYAKGYGTGFIISESGYIVTNYHVVENASKCFVALHDDSVYEAEIICYEESNDIAVIKIEPDGNIQSLVYGNSSELSVGDDIYVIGNPLGDLTFTLTNGVVSALNRLIDAGDGININMFQTNAAINSGNSGGPVFDEHGFVVGIASAKYASASIEGLSFCIPIDDVRSMIDEIINKGYVSGKPLIGISACDREVYSFGIFQSMRSIGGVKIVIVEDGSAAARGGLQAGDIIVAADGKTVTTVSELKTVLTDCRSGDILTFEVVRNSQKTSVSIILDEYEPREARTDSSYIYDL